MIQYNSLDKYLNKLIILTLIFHAFISSTNLNVVQISIEICLILFFLFSLLYFKIKFTKLELFLIILLFFSGLISANTNSFLIFILNFKVFLLPILSLMYFTKFNVRPYLIKTMLIINVLFFLYQILFNRLPFQFILKPFIGSYAVYLNSRPLGLFLNTHYSSYILAIFLIYYTFKKKLFGLDFAILYLTMSKFTLLSFFLNKLLQSKILIYLKKYFKNLIFFLFLIILYYIFKFSDEIYKVDLGTGLSSYNAIAEQLFKSNSYKLSFTFFPKDATEINKNFTNSVGNEVQYFSLLYQGGFLLFLTYIFYLYKHIKFYRIFIFISMLHYGFCMSPLVLYMISFYSTKMDIDN